MAEDVLLKRLSKWKKKVPSNDSLKFEKEDAIEAAVYLRYSDLCLNSIICASSAIQISRALTSARQSA